MRRHSIFAALAAATLGLAACGGSPPAARAPAMPPLATLEIRAVRTPLERTVDGTVEAVNQATVSS